jgi:hypothetical protein
LTGKRDDTAINRNSIGRFPKESPMPDMTRYPGAPRWVKMFGIVAVAVALLLGFVGLTGVGGPHGPAHHVSPDVLQQ